MNAAVNEQGICAIDDNAYNIGLDYLSVGSFEDLWLLVICVAHELDVDFRGVLSLLRMIEELEVQVFGQECFVCVKDRVALLEDDLRMT